MFSSVIFLCLSFLCVTINAKAAPFIDPCKWNDKQCLKTSSQKAIPIVADGVPNLGTMPLDPLVLDNVSFNEGDLNIAFSNMKVFGLKRCEMIDIERNIEEHWLRFVLECPLQIRGDYVATGKIIFVPIQGDGPFDIKSDKISMSVDIDLKTVDNHWQFSNVKHTFDFKEKAYMNFENIFGGDQEKARPVLELIDNQWKEIVQSFGKPIVAEAVNKVVSELKKIAVQVPTNELEQ